MTEKMFSFGVDIPLSWKQIHREYERRFTDLECFLDEDYDGEHHMLWDNQKECWCHLDDALCLMEDDYYALKKEKEQLKQKLSKQETQLDFLKDENRHMRNVLAENRELKQRNKQLSLVGEKQAKFIQSKGFDVKELIDFARDGDVE